MDADVKCAVWKTYPCIEYDTWLKFKVLSFFWLQIVVGYEKKKKRVDSMPLDSKEKGFKYIYIYMNN